MSDDEEVVFGKSDLYKHLIEHGYSDFESFIPENPTSSTISGPISDETQNDLFKNSRSSYDSFFIGLNPLEVSSHDYNKVCFVLNSKLLLKEDLDVIEEVLSNLYVRYTTPKFYILTSTVFTGILSYLLYNKGFMSFIPLGITSLLSIYTSWKFYQEIVQSNEVKFFMTHISTLQQVCLTVHKILRFLKETEIISTGGVPIHNVGAIMYNRIQTTNNEVNHSDKDSLPSWKTLPHLRRCLVVALEKIINSLLHVCNVIKEHSQQFKVFEIPLGLQSVSKHLNAISLLNLNGFHSLKDLQTLIDTYLSIQSEYLSWLAISCSLCFSRNSKEFKGKVLQHVTKIQLELNDVSAGLTMQLNIHNVSRSLTRSSNTSDNSKHLNQLQVEIHNIFLLMLSILLRVRSVEDDLAADENSDNLRSNHLTHQLSVLRDDFSSALRCYDVIYHQILNKNETRTVKQESERDDNCTSIVKHESKPTGIVVGKSDFNVNSPDEVFLALSGLNSEEQDSILDDWCSESKPFIPKNLLSELSDTLKIRKKNFSEREKKALERQGVEDIENNSDESDVEEQTNEFCRKKQQNEAKSKQCKRNILDWSTSISDTENLRKRTTFSQEHCYINGSDSSSESEHEFVNTQMPSTSNLSTSSLANLVAMKSKLWNKNTEESFSDS